MLNPTWSHICTHYRAPLENPICDCWGCNCILQTSHKTSAHWTILFQNQNMLIEEQIVNYFWQIAKTGSLSQQENVQTSAFLQLKLWLHILNLPSQPPKMELLLKTQWTFKGQAFTFLRCIINSILGTTWWHIFSIFVVISETFILQISLTDVT